MGKRGGGRGGGGYILSSADLNTFIIYSLF